VFFLRPDIEQLRRTLGGGQQRGEFLRFEEDLAIGIMRGFQVGDQFLDWDVFIASAESLQGFLWRKGATAATADVVAGKQRPLRTRVRF
jgi:hypothetical protein